MLYELLFCFKLHVIFSQNIRRLEDAYSTLDVIQRAREVLFMHEACEDTELYAGNAN
jgi:hypothetical protein